MRPVDLPPEEQWNDLLQALDFAERRFGEWVRGRRLQSVQDLYGARRKKWAEAKQQGLTVPADTGLAKGHVGESAGSRSMRYWVFVEHEIHDFAQRNVWTLAQFHDLLAEVRERQDALANKLGPDELPVLAAVTAAPEAWDGLPRPSGVDGPGSPSHGAAAGPRRNLLEILLDPRNIQMLLAFGGAMMVVGLVILLWVNEFFTPPVVAVGLGVINAVLLGAGWWVLRMTRYHLAGMGVTLLACLVMPLNLWYYHANGLITIDGHLWLAAVVVSGLYAASAWVLRDELFVYIFCAGVTLTGLLLLADLDPSPQRFWEIALPASLLVVLGLLAIHVERAFPEQEGPFSRQRFGLAFFWSGHALLAAGLLLVLGAEIAGDWLYQPIFEGLYRYLRAEPSPVVGSLRWLALALVLAGTYAYVYSDLVVRRVGVYVPIASGTLLWALVLLLQLANVAPAVDVLIAVLAATALAVNVAQATVFKDSGYTRALPILGVLLPMLAVALGVLVYFRAISPDLRGLWQVEDPKWTYVGAMLLTTVSCRAGAQIYRVRQPQLATVYFFATAAATLVGATALLAALGLKTWQEHAPWLMLVPIAYLVAARLYGNAARPSPLAPLPQGEGKGMRGAWQEQPLLWVSHAAAAVMLLSSLASAVQGFALVEQAPLNLVLALFFVEAAVFYGLAAGFYQQVWTIHLGAAMACAALWQLLTYLGVAAEFYTLTFALVGLALLVAYRFAVLERFAAGQLADAAFQSANTLLSLAFVAALFLGLSRLATDKIQWGLVGLFAVLTVIGLLALALVKHQAWRRWYVVTTIGQAALTFLGVSVLITLTPWQKLEIFSVAAGLLLLAAGHVGWYREQDRQNDLVSVGLLLGSLLVGIPLAAATLIDRGRGDFQVLNELGFLAAAVLLLTSGFMLRLKSTTLVGAGLTALYFATLLIFIPWSRLNAVAISITVGGGTLFAAGLLLSVYRDRLLTLPERIKRREGLFRVLNWR